MLTYICSSAISAGLLERYPECSLSYICSFTEISLFVDQNQPGIPLESQVRESEIFSSNKLTFSRPSDSMNFPELV